jgi:hypothetical protein
VNLRIHLRLLGLVLCLCLLAAPTAARAAVGPGKVPAAAGGGVYWGAWIGPQLTGEEAPWDMGAVQRLQGALGKSLSLVEFSAPFEECDAGLCKALAFPTPGMDAIRSYGAIPVLSWGSQPSTDALSNPEYRLANIAAGHFDPEIRAFAEEAKAWGHPFFLRFNWEMNGTWFLWGNVNGNQPRDFVAAWRHVHDVFDSVGATNATWTWCPYADTVGRFNPIRRYYPGGAYVDWTCLDGYNWGASTANPAPWRSFDFLFHQSYRTVSGLAPSKPMMLGEIATSGEGKKKADWIRRMFKALPRRFPLVHGLVWFEKNDRGTTWTVASSPSSLRAFRAGLRNPRYHGNNYLQLARAPIEPPR